MNIININDNSNKLFYIGGVVRDELLGRNSIDIDITYVGNAIKYCSKFGEVIQKNPKFGTIRVKIPNSNMIVDFASTRYESYPRKGHLPVVEKIGCSLKEDVMRRDFTINALAKSITTGEIVDYVGGLEDLKAKKLKVLHDKSFIDDPTRIVRALKFSMRFGFELDEHTKLLQDEYLKNINYDMSYKRLKKELMETFNQRNICPTISPLEAFINENIYKLVMPNEIEPLKVDVTKLIQDYGSRCGNDTLWLVYVGILRDLSRLPLTKIEKKILDDIPTQKLENDYEICKAFENKKVETILLYAILYDEIGARKYLDNLCNIKVSFTGKDLREIGIAPSPKYTEIFNTVLREKIKNPKMTKQDELELVKNLFA
jgi:tRNA nucleotidyltransferase/poly(A) polymerase